MTLKQHLVLVFPLLICVAGFNEFAQARDDLQRERPVLLAENIYGNPTTLEASGPLKTLEGTPDTRVIDVIGRGTVYHDDVAKARNNAIADALRGVAENAIGLLLSPAAIAEDFQLLSDHIFGETKAFIHDYKVLTESKSGRDYRVLLRATVSLGAMHQKLETVGILGQPKGMPTVVLFMSEQKIDDASPKYWWGDPLRDTEVSATEKAFSEYLREKGFVVLDRTAIDGSFALGSAYDHPELSDEAAARLGKDIGADISLVGKAVGRRSGDLSDRSAKSIQITVDARAVRTDTGALLHSSQSTRGVVRQNDGTAETEAFVLAVSAVAEDMTQQIATKWREDGQQSVLVELVVKGIGEYADFVRFRKHLRDDIRGVKNVYLRSITTDEAKMDVDMVGSPRILADELMLQPFEGLAFNVLEVSEQGLKLELIPSTARVREF